MKKLLLTLILFAVGGTGFLVWRQREAAAKAARVEAEIVKELTESDIRLILESQKQADAETVTMISATAESRRQFLVGLQEHLSLAAEARREGLADDPNFRRNYEYKKNILLADLYRSQLAAEQGKEILVPKEDLAAILNDPLYRNDIEQDLKALREIQTAFYRVKESGFVPPELKGEALIRAQENWARTKILSDKAKATQGFIDRPEIKLRFRILEAGILSTDYLRSHWLKKIRATDLEITEFLEKNGEFDLVRKRKTAEDVLARALGGEEFSSLAKEFSEHRPSRSSGGSMEIEVASGEWPELVEATKTMARGEISRSLVRTEYGVHVLRLIDRKNDGKHNETLSIQQILFQNRFEQPDVTDPDMPAPFMTPEEIARLQVEKRKQKAFVALIVAKNSIRMPDDFSLSES